MLGCHGRVQWLLGNIGCNRTVCIWFPAIQLENIQNFPILRSPAHLIHCHLKNPTHGWQHESANRIGNSNLNYHFSKHSFASRISAHKFAPKHERPMVWHIYATPTGWMHDSRGRWPPTTIPKQSDIQRQYLCDKRLSETNSLLLLWRFCRSSFCTQSTSRNI